MLGREAAEKELAANREPNLVDRKISSVKELPESLRAIALGLLTRDTEGKELPYMMTGRIKHGTFESLIKLDKHERLVILTWLFPHFSYQVESGLELLKTYPYQDSYQKKSFRAPKYPEYTNPLRKRWLECIIRETNYYDRDLLWFAERAAYLGYAQNELGVLFAAAIDRADEVGDEVYDILLDSARGEHAIGKMGRHVTTALLMSSRPEGWEFVEKLLLAAQRQEGLRQIILETVDIAHPEAFRRMLSLLVEQNMTRFSSVLRAMGVWLG